MTEPKLSLVMTLPGGVMISQQAAENKPELNDMNYLSFRTFDEEEKRYKTKTISFETRKSKPAKQVLKMSQEAYDYMLKTPTTPKYNKIIAKRNGNPITIWSNMSEEARIKKHCELIAHDAGATDFYFFILDD